MSPNSGSGHFYTIIQFKQEHTLSTITLVPSKDIEVKTALQEVSRGILLKDFVSPRPDLAGLRLTPLTGGPIYLVNPEGLLQWIPNPETYNNLFKDWDGVQKIDTASLPIATALTNGAVLTRGNGSNPVYIVTNGKKRWITSPAVMDKYHFEWNHIFVVPQTLVDAIPTGGNWS